MKGLSSNLSKILCVSYLSATCLRFSLTKIQSKMKVQLCPQHFLFWHPRASNSKVSWIWQEFQLYSDFMPVLVTCKFAEDLLKKMKGLLCPQHFLRYTSKGNIFGVQGPVTPKRIVQSGRKSNFSKILSLKKSCYPIRSKMKALSCPQHFPIISLWELSVVVGTSFDPICPKT